MVVTDRFHCRTFVTGSAKFDRFLCNQWHFFSRWRHFRFSAQYVTIKYKNTMLTSLFTHKVMDWLKHFALKSHFRSFWRTKFVLGMFQLLLVRWFSLRAVTYYSNLPQLINSSWIVTKIMRINNHFRKEWNWKNCEYRCIRLHSNNVTWVSMFLKTLASRLFVRQLVLDNNKNKNHSSALLTPQCDRWISLTKHQLRNCVGNFEWYHDIEYINNMKWYESTWSWERDQRW